MTESRQCARQESAGRECLRRSNATGDVVMCESDDRQRTFGCGLCSTCSDAPVASRIALFEPLANVVVSDNWRLFLEEFVSPPV